MSTPPISAAAAATGALLTLGSAAGLLGGAIARGASGPPGLAPVSPDRLPIAPASPGPLADAPDTLPALFSGHLIHLVPRAPSGERVLFCTDTGGGVLLVFEGAARRAGWLPSEPDVDAPPRAIAFPAFDRAAGIPPPLAGDGRLLVRPDSVRGPLPEECDGFLGSFYFAGRAWTFDYPHRTVLHHPAGLPTDLTGPRIPVGFQVDSAGRRTSHFPRVEVEIEGERLSLLLDTGAQLRPTRSARAELGLSPEAPAVIATSFIGRSAFDRWRERHPDWPVIERADSLVGSAPMIRVPGVRVGEVELGPAWFTRRPDANFLEYLSRWTDRPVVGALGGSALRRARVTISYPESVAVFRVSGGGRSKSSTAAGAGGSRPPPPAPAVG